MTKDDVSCLIDIKVENDVSADTSLMDYAYDKNIYFSEMIGEKRLFNLIFNALNTKDKTEFFCFCVYKYLDDYNDFNLEICPYYKDIQEFAEIYLLDNSFQKSMNNYQGEDLRFFGSDSDGEDFTEYGGSTRTKAYQITRDFWGARGILKKKSVNNFYMNDNFEDFSVPNNNFNDFVNTTNNFDNQNASNSNKKIGCLPVIIILLILAFLFS